MRLRPHVGREWGLEGFDVLAVAAFVGSLTDSLTGSRPFATMARHWREPAGLACERRLVAF
jgi:hypothetical protein